MKRNKKENKIEHTFICRMIDEHSELIIRIHKLECRINKFFNSNTSSTSDINEYADELMQLDAMKKYWNCLTRRLERQGIYYLNGEYVKHIGKVNTDKLNEE